jgi:hypothetical protein
MAYMKELECKLKMFVQTADKLLERITATLICAVGDYREQ